MVLRPPPILPPSVTYLDDFGLTGANTDIFGSPSRPNSPEPPIVPGTLSVVNQVSILQYDVMVYNKCPRLPIGSDRDLESRRDFFMKLGTLENSLPPHLQYLNNLAPQTIFIK